MHMKLDSSEVELIGKWMGADGGRHSDATCARIDWLTTMHLRKLAVSSTCGGWETLFQDPDDGRYWERTYPQGEMQGGGPAKLGVLSPDEARAKYKF
jgi:Immunity protein 27